MAATAFESVTHRPPPALRPLIASCIGYRYAGFPAGIHRGLPSPHLTVVLPIEPRIDVAAPGSPTVLTYDALAGGLHTTPAAIHHDGREDGIQLAIEPLAARALLGVPAAGLTRAVASLDDLLGQAATELADRLRHLPPAANPAERWAARFALLDEALTAAVARHGDRAGWPVPDELRRAGWRIAASGGAAPIGEVAAEVGWSRRHLAARFRAEMGVTPKTYARLVRFERARRLLQRPGHPGLAAVAAETGYYDQAHLTREFSELVGCPPTRWLAEETLPSVQDKEALAGAA